MRLAWKHTSMGMISLAAVAACDAPAGLRDDLTPGGTTVLAITPAKSVWTWEEVVATGVRATLRNTTTRMLESALGDKFNAAMEQADLFIVKGASGALEREDADGTWRVTVLNALVEGIKRVTLRPGSSYSLTATLREPRRTGTHRIRVDFYEVGGSKVFSDYSEPFEIR